MQTGIPRSTIGYYVGKFKRSGRQRLVPEPVAPSAAVVSALESLITKAYFIQNAIELLASRDFVKLYCFIQSYKMLMQMQSHLTLTKEEKNLFQKTMNAPISHTKERMDSKPELTGKKTMAERLGLDWQRIMCNRC